MTGCSNSCFATATPEISTTLMIMYNRCVECGMSVPESLAAHDEGDCIDIDELGHVLETVFFERGATHSVSGSLLDYIIDKHASILTYEPTGDVAEYNLEFGWPEEFPEDKETTERSRMKDTFLRASIAEHPNLDQVMERLREQDDVIIGIDSNVLWDCILTSHLLEDIYAEPFPNWILIAVPRLVMAETENAANEKIRSGNHPRAGWPSYKGRLGHRALQEAMNIREADPDRPGLAMMSVGEMSDNASDINRDNWRLDALIRNQFQTFLDDINFHKGTFFLSQDRVNVMMSGTEGAQGLYLQKPEIDSFRTGTVSLDQLTRLMFELCLQFGEITIRNTGSGDAVTLEVFWPGKQVSDWRGGRLNIASIDA